jgi:cyclic pyranopterin phosphate synthase
MLIDNFGRTVNYLRLSVTDRCDFRCVYCMAEEMEFVPRQELLTIEEMILIGRTFADLGVTKIRITGGEPLIRRNIMELFHQLGALPELQELTLTTNGSHLKQYAKDLFKSGVRRVNISLDSLKQDRFKQITRTGDLQTVLSGIDTALSTGLKVKLNSVILKQKNSDEVIDLVRFALENKIDISFIEEMPLGKIEEHQRNEEFISSEKLRNIINTQFPLTSSADQDLSAGPSRYWTTKNSNSKIGFISPHSENFCSTCNRVRLTATGRLLLCLGNEHSVDLKQVIREQSALDLRQAIIDSMTIKPERHYFELSDEPQIVRFMNTTGG